jgi:hypothetical protein
MINHDIQSSLLYFFSERKRQRRYESLPDYSPDDYDIMSKPKSKIMIDHDIQSTVYAAHLLCYDTAGTYFSYLLIY